MSELKECPFCDNAEVNSSFDKWMPSTHNEKYLEMIKDDKGQFYLAKDVHDKIYKLIEQLSVDITVEHDKRTSKAVFATVDTLRYSIASLKQLIEPPK